MKWITLFSLVLILSGCEASNSNMGLETSSTTKISSDLVERIAKAGFCQGVEPQLLNLLRPNKADTPEELQGKLILFARYECACLNNCPKVPNA